MRFDIFDGSRNVGSVVWEGPGQVRFDVSERDDREFLTRYFGAEVTYLSTGFESEGEGLSTRRRDWSPWEFQRACKGLHRAGGYQVVATPVGPIEAER
jgi:hypothetical protein